MCDPVHELESKAPLIEYEELVDIVANELLTTELRDVASGVWITGSFVNPDKPLDTGDTPSDMDLLVPIRNWDYPITSSGIAFAAPQVVIPDAYDVESVEWESVIPDMVEKTASDMGASEFPDPGTWDCSVEDVWDQLPEYVCETLASSIRNGFYARPADIEHGVIRTYDIVLGPHDLFTALKDRNEDKLLQLWEGTDRS
jgi:hypothetical protein